MSGIYRLYDKNKELICIGKSYKLGNRIVQSICYRGAYYFDYCLLNKADTDIYEIYYIAKYKPKYNAIGNTEDIPTIELPELKFAKITEIKFEEVGN